MPVFIRLLIVSISSLVFVGVGVVTLFDKQSDKQLDGLHRALSGFVQHVQLAPNDPKFDEQWGLSNKGPSLALFNTSAGIDVAAELAWDRTTGDATVIVAVIDTGIDPQHPDLKDNLWVDPETGALGRNFVKRNDLNGGLVDRPFPSEIDDIKGHGTLVAGIIAARGDNGMGISGVSWQAQIMALRAFDENGNGDSGDVAAAIRYAVDHGARIINMSFASQGDVGPDCVNCQFDQVQYDALLWAREHGVLVVAAAGNDGGNNDRMGQVSVPASFGLDNIIAVAASDPEDHLASFSNFGRINVDLAAPGERILGTASEWQQLTRCPSSSNSLWVCAIRPEAGRTCRATVVIQAGSNAPSQERVERVEWEDQSSSGLIIAGTPLKPVRFLSDPDRAEQTVFVDLTVLKARPLAYQLVFQWKANIQSIDIQCRSTNSASKTMLASGTSAAAAFVSGAAALLLADDPNQDYVSLRRRILHGVTVLPRVKDVERVASGGRLNIAGALGIAATPATTQNTSTVSRVPPATAASGGGVFGLGLLLLLLRLCGFAWDLSVVMIVGSGLNKWCL